MWRAWCGSVGVGVRKRAQAPTSNRLFGRPSGPPLHPGQPSPPQQPTARRWRCTPARHITHRFTVPSSPPQNTVRSSGTAMSSTGASWGKVANGMRCSALYTLTVCAWKCGAGRAWAEARTHACVHACMHACLHACTLKTRVAMHHASMQACVGKG